MPKGWVLEGSLGAGGQAAVLAAKNLITGERAALKHLSRLAVAGPGGPRYDEQRRARFIREARAVRLVHTNVVQYHHAFEDDEGLWLAMELLEGENVRAVLGRHGPVDPLPIGLAVELVAQAARGLAYLHGMGIAHRDVTPENLMVVGPRTLDGEGGVVEGAASEGVIRVKVIDLGIALGVGDRRLTQSRAGTPGTVVWMSPESLSAGEDDADGGSTGRTGGERRAGASDVERAARGDVFSLGVVAFELLTGETPYGPLHVLEGLSYPKLMERVARVQGHSSGMPRVRTRRAEVPEWLDELVAEMLALEPERRPEMSEVGQLDVVARSREGAARGMKTYEPPPVDLEGAGARPSWLERVLGWLPRGRGRAGEGEPRALPQAPAPRALPPPAPERRAPPPAAPEPRALPPPAPAPRASERDEGTERPRLVAPPSGGGPAGWGVLRFSCHHCRTEREVPWASIGEAHTRLIPGPGPGVRAGGGVEVSCGGCKRPLRLFTPGLLPSMVVIPAGKLSMGSIAPGAWEDESFDGGKKRGRTCVEVTLTRPFELGRTPVTQAEWSEHLENRSTYRGDRRPVEQVSWYDAVAYCNRLSARHGLADAYELGPDPQGKKPGESEYAPPVRFLGLDRPGFRLPTEAEWEYACRAGTTDERYGALGEVAWYAGNSGTTPWEHADTVPLPDGWEASWGQWLSAASPSTHDVGTKAPNRFGLFDVLGNVWEWTQGTYQPYGAARETDPLVETSENRVIRGGSFFGDARFVRAANRLRLAPSYRFGSVGFRLARSVVP